MTKYIASQSILSYDKWDCSIANMKVRDFTALAKNDLIKEAASINPDGSVHLQFYYPNALFVLARINKKTVALKRCGKYFCTDVTLSNGLSRIILLVNGRITLYEYLPIAVFSNRLCNYIDIVEKDSLFDEKAKNKGSLNTHILYNPIKKINDRILVYVPYAYYQNPDQRYDVIYLQHGFGENELGWVAAEKVNILMDNLIEQNQTQARIVVMANGLFHSYNGNHLSFEPHRFKDYLCDTIIPYVEQMYRTSNHRFMAGLSMGSVQTSICAFERPDLFEAIGLFSGFLSDPMTAYDHHLSDERIECFKQSQCRLFRCIGNDDKYLPCYLSDEELIKAKDIICTSKRYEGGHEPNVWRLAMIDFLRFIE